jgi:selenide,water dikinase
MQAAPLPLTHDIVLIGGGHTHALVLRKWGMAPLAGARLTLINPGPTAPYSGMLPGHVAGHYTRDALDIDLVRLARFAGARLVLGAAEHLDTQARLVHVPGRPPIAYDLCSVDIGITSEMPALPGFAEHGIPAKPLGRFADAWQAYQHGAGEARVAVIGAGVAGVELALAMAYRLKQRGRPARVCLIDAGTALRAVGPKAQAGLRAAVQRAGIELIENQAIASVRADGVELEDGELLEADFVTGAAGARAHPWLTASGLDLEEGFIRVDPFLQSSDPAVFAAGDCAHLVADPRPKAGVYAVRQAPVLFRNLRAAAGHGTRRPYRAQRDYLKLISMGGKSALGERFGLTFAGGWVWRVKDHIDQGFMARFRDLPEMPQPALPFQRTGDLDEALGDKPLCGGCGAKIGREALRRGLEEDAPSQPLGDDAAIFQTGGVQQVISTDHLRAVCEDAALMTRIAAEHALGDIWAMGAEPQVAVMSLVLPRQSDRLAMRQLAEIRAVARRVLHAAGAELVGGHTSLGDELTIGFTVTGLCHEEPITLAGARAGDALILTKPLGSGTVLAAEMARAARGADVAEVYEEMCRSQKTASALLRGAHAMTDVTGFGLVGHLLNICEASGRGAALDPESIPFLPGALELARAGHRSSLYPANRALAPELPDTPESALLFDPQTCGGLLAAVPADKAEAILRALRDAGYPAARIGQITEGAPALTLVPVTA